MRTLLATLVVAVGVSCSLTTADASAVSSNLVIAQVQTGGAGTGAANQEFVALFNNSSSDIDVSGWCIKLSDYNDSGTESYCFSVAPGMDQVRVAGKGVVFLASASYTVPAGISLTSRFMTSTTLSSTRGHVTLLDATKSVVDRVAWYNQESTPPKYPETLAAAAPTGGSMITRNAVDGSYVDTDNNNQDFVVVPAAPLSATSFVNYVHPDEIVDACPTIDGVQQIMPDGYGYDDAGNCELLSNDICENINLIQLEIPEGYGRLGSNCYDLSLDMCSNLDDLQLVVPEGYHISGNLCKKNAVMVGLKISEVMPNASGIDSGKEYIEIYNPTPNEIDLSYYTVHIGKNAEKLYSFGDAIVAGKSYISFYDSLGFSLLNSTSRVELHFYDGTVVDEIIPYQSPGDDISWSLIDSIWQYTDIQTPGAANQASAIETKDRDHSTSGGTSELLAACPAGKYRNPLTNRCRTIESDVAVLASCDSDEFRNPETNRCKKVSLASVTLAPCNEGYERNPETNRCRKVISDDELMPCEEGYVRNPATNRCKKSLSDVASKAAEAAKETSQLSQQINPYIIAAVAGLGVAGYGLYEWRSELAEAIRRIGRLLPRK